MKRGRTFAAISAASILLGGCHAVPTQVSTAEIEAARLREARSGVGRTVADASPPATPAMARLGSRLNRRPDSSDRTTDEGRSAIRLASHSAEDVAAETAPVLPPAPSLDPKSPEESRAGEPEFSVPYGAWAGELPCSLERFEDLALSNNPAIAEAQARVAALRGKWVQVGLCPNPTAGYAASEVGNENHSGQVGGYFGQELVTGGKLQLNRAVVSQEVRRSQQVLAAQKLRVLTDVRIGYYEVLVAQRRLELTRSLSQTTSRAAESVKKLLAAKEATRADLLQAQVEADNAKLLEQNAVSIHTAAWQRLTIVVGCPRMPPHELTGDLEAIPAPVDWESARLRILGGSPQLGAAAAEVDRSRWAVRQAHAQVVPNVDLQSTFQHDNATNYNISGFQITFPVPMMNYNQGGIRQAQSELVAAKRAVRRTELSLEQKLAQTYQRYSIAQQQAEQYSREILPKIRDTLSLVNEGYRGGEASFLQLLTAQHTYVQTNLTYLDSLQNLWTAFFEIEGLLLRDSLNQAPAAE